MKVAMGADGAGFALKEAVKADLLKKGYEIIDTNPDEPVLYQYAARAVAGMVQRKEVDRGIIMCGTGMGLSIIANKHEGVYAALCESVYTARRAKVVNNTNVLCMGGFVVGNVLGIEMANAWLEAEHLVGLDDETRKIVEKEFSHIVEYEREAYHHK